jgi:hypothetical protein
MGKFVRSIHYFPDRRIEYSKSVAFGDGRRK